MKLGKKKDADASVDEKPAKKAVKKPAKAVAAPLKKPAKRYKATLEGANDRQHHTGAERQQEPEGSRQ